MKRQQKQNLEGRNANDVLQQKKEKNNKKRIGNSFTQTLLEQTTQQNSQYAQKPLKYTAIKPL
jgi:hypothetical protein